MWVERPQMRTLYVGGLPVDTDEPALRALFKAFEGVASVRVVTKEEGGCRGFGYVTFDDDDIATRAQAVLDGRAHQDTTLRVAFAT